MLRLLLLLMLLLLLTLISLGSNSGCQVLSGSFTGSSCVINGESMSKSSLDGEEG